MSLAMILATSTALAQNEQGQRRARMNTTEMFNRQAERLAKTMKLDDEKTELFTVLYLDYQTTRMNAANPKGENDEQERIDMKKITDEQATELINKQLARTEAQLKVDKEYLAKFLEFLTPTQVVNIFAPQRNARNMGGERPQGFGRGGFGGPGGGFGGGNFGGFGGPGGDF